MRTPNHLEIKKRCQDSVAALMEKHRLGSPTKIVMDETGWVNPCFFVNEAYVFRFNARDPLLPKYQREKFAFDLLKNTSVPVPPSVILDDTKTAAPYDVLISQLISGRNLETDWPKLNSASRARLAEEAGRIFAQISRIQLPFFGELALKGPLPRTSTWSEYLQTKLDFHFQEAAPLQIFDTQQVQKFWDVFHSRKNALAQVSSAHLVHADFHFGNLLYLNDRISGVFDFEWAFAGDPLYEMTRWQGTKEDWPQSRTAFLKGANKETFSQTELELLQLYQMIQNIELCVVAKLHFEETEAETYKSTALAHLEKISYIKS